MLVHVEQWKLLHLAHVATALWEYILMVVRHRRYCFDVLSRRVHLKPSLIMRSVVVIISTSYTALSHPKINPSFSMYFILFYEFGPAEIK